MSQAPPPFPICSVAQIYKLYLGYPVRLTPNALTDLGPESTQEDVQYGRTSRCASEPRRRDGFDERVGYLVAPDERTPQRTLDLGDAPDDDPLGGDGDRARHCSGDEQNYAAQQSREPESDGADQCFACKQNTEPEPARDHNGDTSNRFDPSPGQL